jgi:hypothetical protein
MVCVFAPVCAHRSARLNSNHACARRDTLDDCSDATKERAAANADKDGIDGAARVGGRAERTASVPMLPQQLEAHCACTGEHGRCVVRAHIPMATRRSEP